MSSVTTHPYRDLSASSDLFDKVLEYFNNDSEEVRSAAAFAAGKVSLLLSLTVAGNLAVGSPKVFLAAIVTRINSAKTEGDRVLLLHALKEVRFSFWL